MNTTRKKNTQSKKFRNNQLQLTNNLLKFYLKAMCGSCSSCSAIVTDHSHKIFSVVR